MNFVAHMIRDLRHALRTLRGSPGFTIIAVAVLALGIGASTAIFSVVNRVLLQPLPYPDPDRLVQLEVETELGKAGMVSIPQFITWREYTKAFTQMAAYDLAGPRTKLAGNQPAEQLKAIHASADYFSLFGAALAIGRTYSTEEDRPGGSSVAVISHSVWRQYFGGDANLPGKVIYLEDGSYDVVGVLRPGFTPYPVADIWIPLQPGSYSTDHTLLLRSSCSALHPHGRPLWSI